MTRHSGLIAILAFAAVAVAGVILRPAVPVDETRYLSVAWEMHANGNWLVPTKNFELYTDKPPVLFWMINLVWLLTGISEFSARLVGPAFAVLSLILTGRLARSLWPGDTAVSGRAVVALAGMLAFSFYGSLTMFDAALTAATVAGVFAVLRAVDTGQRRYWVVLGAAMAAGGLIKGPVILFHLLPVALLAPLWARERANVTWGQALGGVLLAISSGLALVALWLVPAVITGGQEYRDAILWTQSAGRLSTSFAHAKPWWFFIALLPVILFPWFLVPALWRAAFRQDWSDPALRLCLVWAGVALILFSATSGKQMHYLIPELPAAALIIARMAPERFSTWIPAAIHVAIALFGIAVVAGLIDLGRHGNLFEPLTAVLTWAIVVIGVCLFSIRAGGLTGGLILSLGVILAFNLLFGLTVSRSAYDSHQMAAAIAPHEETGIAFYGQNYHSEFTFAGRLTSHIANPMTIDELNAWTEVHPEGIVIARLDRTHPDWSEDQVMIFRNAPYAIWRVVDAPRQEPSS